MACKIVNLRVNNPVKVITFSLSWLILICLCGTAMGQSKNDSLEKNLLTFFTKNKLPGLHVTLVNANSILYQHSFGYADSKEKKPFDSNTIENIGSVSKTFIGCAIMKAIEQGYFTLETDINTILPFKAVNPFQPEAVISVKDLVTHTSGITDNQEVYKNCYQFQKKGQYSGLLLALMRTKGYKEKVTDTSLRQFLYNYLSVDGKWYSKQNFSENLPGQQYNYSNIASALSAYLIEVKSGMSFAAYTEKYIFSPLHMAQSGWFIDSNRQEQYARLYYNASWTFPLYSLATYPDGGLRTSAADLTNYLMALIKGYAGDSNILNSKSYQAMFTPLLSGEVKDLDLKKENRGTLWNIYKNVIDKDGDDPGISTYIFFNKKTGIGGFFLCNKLIEDNDDLVSLLHQYAAH